MFILVTPTQAGVSRIKCLNSFPVAPILLFQNGKVIEIKVLVNILLVVVKLNPHVATSPNISELGLIDAEVIDALVAETVKLLLDKALSITAPEELIVDNCIGDVTAELWGLIMFLKITLNGKM